MPRATSLAAEIKEQFGVDAELIAGSGGVFDIVVGDEVIYSKKQSGNEFPADGVVLERLKEIA